MSLAVRYALPKQYPDDLLPFAGMSANGKENGMHAKVRFMLEADVTLPHLRGISL